ncbi:nicotinate-nucleotide adenylyltransferase [Chloroflexota bacterium]
MKIGIMGGTFDPVHIGHLIVAEEARYQLGLDKVVFLPAGRPWFKSDRIVTEGKVRLEMIKSAIKDNRLFEVSDLELEREGPTYSIDSISELREQFGGAELYFLIGLDALAEIHRWKHPDELIGMCQVIGLTRPGYTDFDWSNIKKRIAGASQKIKIIQVSQIGVSSGDIRMMVQNGISVRYLVPDAVVRYIEEKGLYKLQVT